MEDFHEDEIWDSITASAKIRIDHEAFSSLFPFNSDNFLSSIIYGFAVGRSATLIADKISAQLLMTGNAVDQSLLVALIEGYESVLNKEITLTLNAIGMLNSGAEPEAVYEKVAAALLL